METIKKWVWQHENYPNFNYKQSTLNSLLLKISRHTGRLEGAIYGLNDKNINSLVIDASINEILQSSEIEGEILSRDSVRSSVRKKLDESFDYLNDSSTRHTDGLVLLLLDSQQNDTPLTHERLHGWHSILFPTGYSDGHKIDVATYRSDEMSVVSSRGYREKIHYLAPPHGQLTQEMNKFLDYVNNSKKDPFIKSAIAHIWFVSIHPYDDGNGRIARIITNYVLAKELGLDHKYYSLSTAIRRDRKSYYDILERSQNLFYNREFDFTKWILWHTNIINSAIETSLEQIKIITQKTKFWDRARDYPLNKRQLKVLNKLLDKGIENFEGGLSTKKYAKMVKTSIPTAKRDITGLIDYGVIEQVKGSAGRNIRYVIKL
ncbi:Fic family protein [hydrothermal vent metagenome]|uniref:Fic family protein n=1 Tax=hydrothermal vent metagenome TaxID=652676 RepID=A0A1W1CKU9_9ZZZZ